MGTGDDLQTLTNADLGGTLRDMVALTGASSDPSSFIPQLLAGLIFGTIGFFVFLHSQKNRHWRNMIIGIVMMIYPYFVSHPIFVWVIGIILTALLYFWKE